jgi:hypothetical protein
MKLTDDQRRALAPVLDGFIPQSTDGTLPGAGEIAAELDEALQRMPELHAAIVASLAALDRLAERRGAARFTALSPDQQVEALRELSCTPEAFPPMLMLHTLGAYYAHPRVLEHYGLEARAPHPEGYEVPPNDLSLLEPVRKRGPIYRACD